MSLGAARRSVDIARGNQVGMNQDFVSVEGHLWMVIGDMNVTHGISPHVEGEDPMVTGSIFVNINGIPVCRESDIAACGHDTTGSAVVFTNA